MVEFDRQELLAAAKAAATPTPKHPYTPLFGGMLVETVNNTFRLAGTDTLTTVVASIPVDEAREVRSVVADARKFAAAVGRMKSSIVELHIKDDAVLLSGEKGDAHYTFSTFDPFGWPLIEAGEVVGHVHNLDSLALVARAASTDQARPVLNVVKLESDGDSLVAAATDSYRLHYATVGKTSTTVDLSVPLPLVSAYGKSSRDGDSAIVTLGQRTIAFSSTGIFVSSSLIDGAFPKWKSLVRDKSEYTVSVEADSFKRAVTMVRLAAETDIVGIDFFGGYLVVFASGGGTSAKVELPTNGEFTLADEVAFRAPYLLDAIDQAGAALVTLGIEDRGKPVVFSPGGAVVMPIRT